METSAIIGLTCTLTFVLHCFQSCYLFFSLNSIYDRLDTLEQVTWSQRTSNPIQNTNPIPTTNPSYIQRTEDPI
jgi:hypothetical protein